MTHSQGPPLLLNEDIPEGWVKTTLEAITESVSNVDPKKTPDRDFGYVDISSIDNQKNQIVGARRFKGKDAPSRARRPIQPGDVLFSNVRTYLRNIAQVPSESDAQLCSTGFTVLRSNGAADPKFIFYSVLSNGFVDAVTIQQTGSNYPATNDRVVRSSIVGLPPLAEQRRIAAKVEGLLSRASGTRERLANVPLILNHFRQVVLAGATSGDLTSDWREESGGSESVDGLIESIFRERRERYERALESAAAGRRKPKAPKNLKFSDVHLQGLPELPSTWRWVTWDDLVDWITYGFTRLMPHVDSGIPIITAKNVYGSRIHFDRIHHTTDKAFVELSEKDRPQKGEILLTKDGSIGRAAIVNTEDSFCVNQSVAVLRFGGRTTCPTCYV